MKEEEKEAQDKQVEAQEDEGDIYMVAELCTTEYGSVDHADADEITIEKSIDVCQIRKKPDLQSFDYEAFYKKQGVHDSPRDHL